jgi:uncharacterized membrane protein
MFLRKGARLKKPEGFCRRVLLPGLLAAAVFFSFSPGIAAEKAKASAPAEFSFPLSQFADGKARHYTYDAPGGIIIKYFIVKSSDGAIRAAFDACDVCWPSGKGYQQEGDNMVCRNCGKKFASKLVNEVKGGCNPAPLKRTVKGDKLVIQAKDILDGRNYFNF